MMTDNGHDQAEQNQADPDTADPDTADREPVPAGASPGSPQASPARIHNFWLGGKDHYQIDRAIGSWVTRQAPWVAAGARAGRGFLADAVRRLAEAGITQFLDIGSGLPFSPNVHEVARKVTDEYQVVYVDNDPLVLSNARALLETDGRELGRDGLVEGVHVLDGDLFRPEAIWRDLETHLWLDLDRPVALLLTGVLQFVPDDATARRIVTAFTDRLCPGSYVVFSHISAEDDARGRATRAAAARYASRVAPFQVRSRAQMESLFAPGDLIDPGLQPLTHHGEPAEVLAGILLTHR